MWNVKNSFLNKQNLKKNFHNFWFYFSSSFKHSKIFYLFTNKNIRFLRKGLKELLCISVHRKSFWSFLYLEYRKYTGLMVFPFPLFFHKILFFIETNSFCNMFTTMFTVNKFLGNYLIEKVFIHFCCSL